MQSAIIYVRGHNTDQQRTQCENYAHEKGYKVLCVTDDINSVNNCDVLIVAHQSRISRKMLEHQRITRELKEKGVKVESVAGQNNNDSLLEFLKQL